MFGHARQRWRGRHIISELFSRQEPEHVFLVVAAVPIAREKGSLAADDQRAVAWNRFAVKQLRGRKLLGVVPEKFQGAVAFSSRKTDLQNAPLRRAFVGALAGVH